jgi:hypothetical protein
MTCWTRRRCAVDSAFFDEACISVVCLGILHPLLSVNSLGSKVYCLESVHGPTLTIRLRNVAATLLPWCVPNPDPTWTEKLLKFGHSALKIQNLWTTFSIPFGFCVVSRVGGFVHIHMVASLSMKNRVYKHR